MSDDEKKIGYGNPPKATRFKKGQSGNPKGRPKGHKNFKTDLADELGETIAIQENGKKRTITKQRALIKATVAKAIKGDTKATNSVMGMVLRLLTDMVEDSETENLSEVDKLILERFTQAVLEDAARKGDPSD